MELITTVAGMSARAHALRASGKSVGFVPTMGCLHEGHLSLARMARAENDIVALSIFVNPAQFGPDEDLDRYPRDMEGDLDKCRFAGVDIVFAPPASEMYQEGHCTFVDVGRVKAGLCGGSRPGHFRGVATVVGKLFNIVRPVRSYFGQKDFQQTVVIKRMARDLNFETEIIVGETVREPDGLAMSSRNRYLKPDERKAAAAIYRALMAAKALRDAGERDPARIVKKAGEVLSAEPMLEVEYIEAVDAVTLDKPEIINDNSVLAIAASVGGTRLIDNIFL
ncbi:MAG TPA: pantoate--beta-alanine ligase [Nitrospirota bacterium]|nr:pantoate--beta-alanine ligase [Nitrospirota bacterium]